MLCDNCDIEMRLDIVKEDTFTFKCVKCGKTLIKKSKEIDDLYKAKNEQTI